MSEQGTEAKGFESWAILELFGHRKLAGYVTESEIGGGKLLRIDVPGKDGAPVATQFYGAGAIYCMTPCSEQVARRAAANFSDPSPVTKWDLALPAPSAAAVDPDDDDGEPI